MSDIRHMKDGTEYNIGLCAKNQWDDAMELAFKVFLKYESKQYGKEGTDNFANFLTSPSLEKLYKAGKYIVFVATLEEKVIGMISVRNGNHISLLFVDEKYHRQGVAGQLIKKLQDYLLKNTDYQTFTVNASPYGIPFYEKTGFKATGEETVTDGIIYTPMEMFI